MGPSFWTFGSKQLTFTIWCNNVTSLGHAPGNRIAEPDDQRQDAAEVECAVDVGAQGGGVATADERELIEDVEHGRTAKGEETPFVAGADERADQTCYDHNLVESDNP